MDSGQKIKQYYLDQIKEVLAQKNISVSDNKNEAELQSVLENKRLSDTESNNKKRQVEVVVFTTKNDGESSKATSKKTKYTTSTDSIGAEDKKLLEAKRLLKEIEWDVTSFGLKGFSVEEKRKMEQERAIRLGAQPRKQKYVNYKVLMEERKKQKESGQKKTEKQRKKKTVFWKESTSMSDGMRGKFKDGVLKLSRDDMESM